MTGSVDHEAQWSFQPAAAVVAESRALLTAALHAWGMRDSFLSDTVLVANELVANAVDHALTVFNLTARLRGQIVTLSVHDNSSAHPVLQPHDVTARRGRGLQLVDYLSLHWGCIPDEGGKTVWAEVRSAPA